MEAEEWDINVDTLIQKRMFANMDLRALVHECINNLKNFESLAEVINGRAPPFLTSEDRNMVFLAAVDIVLVDGSTSPQEQQIIEYLKENYLLLMILP